jgi:hypothetical protein
MNTILNKKFIHLSYWSDTWQNLPSGQKKLFKVVMFIHLLITILFISNQGVTSDESGYFTYAIAWAKGHPERNDPMMDSKTPLVAFSLIGTFFKQWLPENLLINDAAFYLKAGRPFMYVYQLLGCYIVFCWLNRLWGTSKWLLPFLFFCFDPLIFSYSMIIGSDLASASILTTIIYSAWRFTVSGNKKYWWLLCVAAAWGLVLKPSFIFCIPLLAMLFFINAVQKKQWNWKKASIQLIQFTGVHILFINCIYYFKGTETLLGELHFQSALLKQVQAAFHFVSWMPVPLPTAFIQGFDLVQRNIEYGCCKPESTFNGIIILGKIFNEGPVWYYYIVTAIFKIPLLVWAAFVVFIVKYLATKKIITNLRKYYFIWLPFVYFFVVLSFLFKVQIGIRHAILLLPFLYIGISGVLLYYYEKRKWLFRSLLLLHCISLIMYWPNIMAYTNELIWNKSTAYKFIADSSIDYGQTNLTLQKFLKEHPDYTLPPNTPTAGKFAVTLGRFVNRTPDLPIYNYAWLRNNFEPIDNYRYTILLFTITDTDLKKVLNKTEAKGIGIIHMINTMSLLFLHDGPLA